MTIKLAKDISPDDWRVSYIETQTRIKRVRWCKLEGNFWKGYTLPKHAIEVKELCLRAYQLAKEDSKDAEKIIESFFDTLKAGNNYEVFYSKIK